VATLDVLTLAEGQQALPGVKAARDADIEGYVTAVSLRLDDLCGPIVQRAVTEVHADAGGCSTIVLREVPASTTLTSITDLRYYGQTPVAVDPLSLYVAPTGVISSRLGFYGPVTVTYTAGRFATTAAVSPLFKTAARVFLQHLWRRQEGGGSVTFGSPDTGVYQATYAVPNAVLELVGTEARGPVVA